MTLTLGDAETRSGSRGLFVRTSAYGHIIIFDARLNNSIGSIAYRDARFLSIIC